MNLFDRIFKGGNKTSSILKVAPSNIAQDLVLSERMDTETMRNIWYNIEKDYKLGASVIKCGISALIDYIGIPRVYTARTTNKTLEAVQNGINKMVNTIHRKSFVEGNFFVWSNWNDKKKEVEHVFFNFENMINPVFDVDTKELIEVTFEHEITWCDNRGFTHSFNRKIRFTDEKIYTYRNGSLPAGKKQYEEIKHNLGRLPLVFHRYNKNDEEIYAHGLIEATDPFLRVLSDVILNRAIEDRRSSRKKLSITAKNPEEWLANTAMLNGIPDGSTDIDLENLDIIFNTFTDGGEAESTKFIEVGQTAADSLNIAHMMIAFIREELGTPEWIYPSKLGASYASVSAQVPSWIHHIENIRNNELAYAWNEQAELDALVYSKATGSRIPKITVFWKRLDLETPELRAKIVNYMIASMKIAREQMLMTDEEIRDYLDDYMNSLGEYTSLEKEMPNMLKNLKDLADAKGGSDEPQDQSDRNRPTDGENLVTNEERDKTSE